MIIENLEDIEIFLSEKYKDEKIERFFHRSKNIRDRDHVISWYNFIQELGEVIEQHLVDEDFTWDTTMPEFSEDQWEEWRDPFYVPQLDY